MKPVKAPEKVKRMFAQGQTDLVDAQSRYKYSMVARCRKDGNFAPVTRMERTEESLSRVIFRCSLCDTEFEASEGDIYLR